MRALLFALALLLGLAPASAAPGEAEAGPGETRARGASPALPVRPELGPQTELARYALPAANFEVVLGPEVRTRRTVERPVRFQSAVAGEWAWIHGTYYAPASSDSPLPAAVVVHHLGGSFEAEKVLAKHLATNGVAAVHPADVLMLNARRDELVPTESTLALWGALGKPRLEWFDCGHYGLALHLGKVMNLTLDHLKGRDPF